MGLVFNLLVQVSMNRTQVHYGKMVQKKVSDERKNLQLKLLENKTPLL